MQLSLFIKGLLFILQYFYDIAQNPETNQPIKGSPALSHKSFLSSRGPMSDFMPTDSSEHLYAEPAQIREYRNPSPMSHYHDPDRLALNRIKREFEMKEKFMNRPPEDFNTTLVTSEELRESPRPKKSSRSRKQKSDSPSRVPRPSETFVDGMMCSKGGKTFNTIILLTHFEVTWDCLSWGREDKMRRGIGYLTNSFKLRR